MIYMLTFDELYVLRRIIKISKSHINSRDELLSLVSKKFDIWELDSILDSLYDKNFFEKEHYTKFLNGGRAFTIVHNTKHFYELTIKKVIHFFINSIIVPAAVAWLTALIAVG